MQDLIAVIEFSTAIALAAVVVRAAWSGTQPSVIENALFD
jgi:hypothetical protein